MTYEIESIINQEEDLRAYIAQSIEKNNFNFGEVLKKVYITNNKDYVSIIKKINPLKEPSKNACGQFLFVENKGYIVLNYDIAGDKVAKTLIHELTHLDNHLIFIKNDKLKNLLDSQYKNNQPVESWYKMLSLDMVDEYIAIKNEREYGEDYSFNDFDTQMTEAINNVNKQLTQNKINQLKGKILNLVNKNNLKFEIFTILIKCDFFRIIKYTLPRKNEEKYPLKIENEKILNFVENLHIKLQEIDKEYLIDKNSINEKIDEVENILIKMLDELIV